MTRTLQLSWPTPADRWDEAVPLGNGRIGAMAFGGPSGRYALNDATVWSGTPDGPAQALRDVIAAGAGPARLAEVRTALDAGDVRTAEGLLMAFEGRYSQEFLPLADLELRIANASADDSPRVLDLDDAVLTETLRVPGGTVQRRSWVSAPAQALIIELTADVEFAASIALATPLHGVAVVAGHGAQGMTLDITAPIDGAPLHESSVEPPLRYAESDTDFDAFAAVAVAAGHRRFRGLRALRGRRPRGSATAGRPLHIVSRRVVVGRRRRGVADRLS